MCTTKKQGLAGYLLDIISTFEHLSQYSITLQHPGNLDINHINQVVSKCITKECNDVSKCHEFNINTVRDDIKKLDVLIGELKSSITNFKSEMSQVKNETHDVHSYTSTDSDTTLTSNKISNPTEHIKKYAPNYISDELGDELIAYFYIYMVMTILKN